MSKSDGTIVFNTEMDNKELAKQVEEAKKEVEAVEGKLKELNKDRTSALKEQQKAQEKLTKAQVEQAETEKKVEQATKRVAEVKERLVAAQEKLNQIQREKAGYEDAKTGSFNPDTATDAQAFVENYKTEDEWKEALKSAKSEVSDLEKELKSAEQTAGRIGEKFLEADNNTEKARVSLREAETAVNNIDESISSANATLGEAEAKAGGLENQFKKAEARSKKLQKPIDKASDAVNKLGKRITSVAMSALVFSTLYKAFGTLKERISDAISTNEEAAQAMAKLKGAVLTLIQPIIDVAVPAITAMANALTHLITLSMKLFGNNFFSNSKKAAKDLSNQAEALDGVAAAAKKASSQLAGFDELNIIGSNTAATSSEETPTSPDFDFELETDEVSSSLKIILAAVTAIGAALLTWKISNAFTSGINTTAVAVTLLVAGITAVVFALHDWITTGELTNEMCTVLVLGILAIGAAIALLTGSWIPMVVAAVVALVAVFFQMFGDTEQLMQGLKEIFSGLIDFFVGVFTGDMEKAMSGIGKVVSGLQTVIFAVIDAIKNAVNAALDWFDKITGGRFGKIIQVLKDYITDSVKNIKQVLSGIITFISGVFTGDWKKAWQGVKQVLTGMLNQFANSIETVINGIIAMFEKMINWIVGGLNEISVDIPDWKIFGEYAGGKFGFNIDPVSFGRVSLPRLAQGAVLPANQPFLAMVGDQKHGTNVEAPLTTIQEAVAEVMGDMLPAMVAGFETVVDRLERLENTVGQIEVGDTVIGQANDRYQRRMNIMCGIR